MKAWVLLVLMFVALGCEPKRGKEEEVPPQVLLLGVKMRYYKGERMVTTGRAAKVTFQRWRQDFTASEALLQFAGKAPRSPGAEVRARTAFGSLQTKQADGEDGVVMKTSDGAVGTTERAHFDGNTAVATGSDPVVVEGPGYGLTADRFKLDFVSEVFLFEGNVTSRLGGER